MYYRIFNWPFMRWFFRQAKAIPIASAKDKPEMVDRAFDRIAEDLEAGELVCIFPEGAITTDGQVQMFRRGVERILARTPVPVVPMGLSGLWGSFFSRSDGGAMRGPMRKLLGRLHMAVGEPLSPEEATADRLREQVLALMEAEDYKEPQGL